MSQSLSLANAPGADAVLLWKCICAHWDIQVTQADLRQCHQKYMAATMDNSNAKVEWIIRIHMETLRVLQCRMGVQWLLLCFHCMVATLCNQQRNIMSDAWLVVNEGKHGYLMHSCAAFGMTEILIMPLGRGKVCQANAVHSDCAHNKHMSCGILMKTHSVRISYFALILAVPAIA